MSVSAPRRKVEDLEAQIAAHWEHQSELTLHRMLRDATMLFPKSDLEETQRLHIVNGMVWLRLKNPREAAASFKAVLDIGERGLPEVVQIARVDLAVALMNDGHASEALEYLLQAADADNERAWEDVVLLANLVVVLVALGRFRDALPLFEAAEAAAKMDTPDHLYRLATAAAALQNYHQAAELLERLLQVTTGENGDLLERHALNLDLTPDLRRAVDYVAAYRAYGNPPLIHAENPDMYALKLEIMEELRPLRERANAAILGQE